VGSSRTRRGRRHSRTFPHRPSPTQKPQLPTRNQPMAAAVRRNVAPAPAGAGRLHHALVTTRFSCRLSTTGYRSKVAALPR
jgi:hypothetical protein